MSTPDNLPIRRPISLGSGSLPSVAPSKRLRRAEAAVAEDIALHELDSVSRLIKAETEAAANEELLRHIARAELGLYDELLDEVGGSVYKQRRLAHRMTWLVELNDNTLRRYAR